LNINYHKLIGQLLLALLIAGTCTLFIGAMRTKSKAFCSSVTVSMKASKLRGFVDERELLQTITLALKTKIIGTEIQSFNLKHIESTLESNMWISNAQLYFDNNNVLHIIVEQRYPIARIITNSGNAYYIDSNFLKLPLSKTEQAEVPIFTGFSDSMIAAPPSNVAKAIVAMSKHIITDPFWLAQAAQIDFVQGKFVLYPSVGNHTCQLGDGSNAENKLNRLKWFYRTTAKTEGFDRWSSISAQFDNQIVASKADSSAAGSIDAEKAMQVFSETITSNKKQAEWETGESEPKQTKPLKIKKNNDDTADKIPAAANTTTAPTVLPTQTNQPKAVMPKNNNN
jgi:cell division protein FtsQ